jgi:hypothetical protein
MMSPARVIVELARDGAVDRQLRADPPPSVLSGQVVLDHIAADASGSLGPPEAAEVVMSVLSPEALTRDRQEVRDVIRRAAPGDEPLMIVVQAAGELREEELAVVLEAAQRANRLVIVRIMAAA